MDQGEYLQTVLDQIRCKRAKELIAEELENHIEDQKQALIESGIEEQEAAVRAVKEMGDPIAVGAALDRIHRPKMEWKMLVLVIGMSILGLLLQAAIAGELGAEIYPGRLRTQAVGMAAGLLIMTGVCFLDYSRIGLKGTYGAAALLLLFIVGLRYVESNAGQSGCLGFWETFPMHLKNLNVLYLYIPFFGGILYQYRDQGKKGLLKSIIWMSIPVGLALSLPRISIAGSLLFIMLVQLCAAMKWGWFQAAKKGVTAVISLLVGFPVLMAFSVFLLGGDYQRTRILSMLGLSGARSYQQATARELIRGSSLIGQSAEGIGGILPDIPDQFIFTYVFSYYGILAAAALTAVLVLFMFKIFKIGMRQKNRLGQIMGLGCSMVFLVQIVMYVLVNLTIIPHTTVFLPLFSYGGMTGAFVSYALLGILLSIYRYQNVLPAYPGKRGENEAVKG